MTFDGPGRQAALRRQGLVLRPDWEAVLGPVADAMAARADVDGSRMVVIGIEHAGYGVARATALHRRRSPLQRRLCYLAGPQLRLPGTVL